ncbi:Gp15 family bacteriophage protein [Ruminococcus flavefaciens]|uniref:Gp15 family bacteriophage protein n=1 Tax=Ruminococcus flavefaciens TaxID=1265 RepID=UPI0026EB07A6|nr:Gp15 family bacteriophage protein [Ruminococcus flavefaciens]
MIGELPQALEIGGVMYPINSDYRYALLIFEAYGDPELDAGDKAAVCVNCLFRQPESIPPELIEEAYEQAVWFLDGGDMPHGTSKVKTYDWQQDESLIFSAVNNVAKREVREPGVYTHWWTFLGYFMEIGEGILSTVIHIRKKQAKGKPLEKYEQEYLAENRSLVELKKRLSDEEQAEYDAEEAFVDSLFKGC